MCQILIIQINYTVRNENKNENEKYMITQQTYPLTNMKCNIIIVITSKLYKQKLQYI